MDLGERILIARRRKRLSQQALADAVGVNKATIYRIERGSSQEIPVGTLKNMALALGVSTDWLLGLTADDAEEVTAGSGRPMTGVSKRPRTPAKEAKP